MNGAETSTPRAEPPGPTSSASRWVVSPKPQPMSIARSPGRGGFDAIATSPWAPSPPVVRSRYLRKTSKRGPLQASVASAFSGATSAMPPIVSRSAGPVGLLRLAGGEFDAAGFGFDSAAEDGARILVVPEQVEG